MVQKFVWKTHTEFQEVEITSVSEYQKVTSINTLIVFLAIFFRSHRYFAQMNLVHLARLHTDYFRFFYVNGQPPNFYFYSEQTETGLGYVDRYSMPNAHV
jgi:hypothetical protein